jgi:hypothetical protein
MSHELGEVEVFVHSEGAGPKSIRLPAEATLAEVLAKAGVEHQSDFLVFVGESVEALEEAFEVEDGEDGHEPVPVHHLLHHHAGHHRTVHVHCHRCRRIAVSVNYHEKTQHHRFSPATTVETVKDWVRRKLHLHDPDDDRLILKDCGTGEQPRSDVHLGELVKSGACTVCFDLVSDVKVEG